MAVGLMVLAVTLIGCADPEPGEDSAASTTAPSTTTSAGSGSSSSSGPGSSTGSDPTTTEAESSSGADSTGGGVMIPDFNGCTVADYEDRSDAAADRTIAIALEGLSYTPKCMIVAAGQTVRWEGSLSAHPLAPGNPEDGAAGSPDNPVVPTSSGTSVELVFPSEGTFPYYCELHSFGAGQGMAGVVHVLAAQ